MMAELKQRLRGRRWWWLLLAWVVVLFLISLLVWTGAERQAEFEAQFTGDPFIEVGPVMFGTLALFILGLMSLVLPSLTATGINAERDRGTLAILQTTLLQPWEITLAKFLSGFLTALAFLAVTAPLTIWSMAEGGVPVVRVLVVYLVLAVAAAVYLVIGLAMSALIRRPGLSALASYVAVFALTAGLPIAFALSLLSARETVETRFPGTNQTFTTTRTVIGWRWILLAPDPFVVLADAAPRQRGEFINDPLTALRSGVRASREQADRPLEEGVDAPLEETVVRGEPPPVWPTGLAIQLGLFAVAGYAVIRRLQVPARRLAAGERIA